MKYLVSGLLFDMLGVYGGILVSEGKGFKDMTGLITNFFTTVEKTNYGRVLSKIAILIMRVIVWSNDEHNRIEKISNPL